MKALYFLPLLLLFQCKSIELEPCEAKTWDPDCNCITLYDPVCGCDNITYGNSCAALCQGITEYTEGECK